MGGLNKVNPSMLFGMFQGTLKGLNRELNLCLVARLVVERGESAERMVDFVVQDAGA